MKLFVCFSFFITFTNFVAAQDRNPSPVAVTAPAGTVIGQTGRLNPTVHEFLGIPYAEAPTGPLRFEPPIRKRNFQKPVLARAFGLSCPSFIAPGIPHGLNVTEGEDCLSVNIWARPGLKDTPVLVWFYGGSFYNGTSNVVLYDGTYFAAHNDVVVVTFNYRTNVFGFPNSPALSMNNLGLLDQRMAVEWVRDNIAAFGGNPNQITIFGQSAGAISVDLWAFAWVKDPIVKGFITESGEAISAPDIGGGSTYDAWNSLTDVTGCSSGTEPEKLKCVKGLDWKTVKSALDVVWSRLGGPCNSTYGLLPGLFGPRVDGKLVFSVEEYVLKGVTGEFAKLPLLTGTNDKEIPATDFTVPQNPGCPSNDNPFPELPVKLTPEIYGEVMTSLSFGCPERMQARFRAVNNVPVWRYRFFDSLNFTTPYLNMGAVHASEIPIVFGFAAEVEKLHPREEAVLKQIQSAWVAFAKDPVAGLSRAPFKWGQYTMDELSKNLVRLAYGQESEASMSRDVLYDYWCDILEAKGI